jgi:hypothetical protein
LDKGPLLDKALVRKHLEDPPLTLHLDGWLSHPLEKKKVKRVGKSLEPSIITYNYSFLDIKTSLKPSLLVIIVILGSQHW